jgi:aromatic-amino-acid transaminase
MANGQVITAQALGGTGALKIGADLPEAPEPERQGLHQRPVLGKPPRPVRIGRFPVENYPYYDAATRGVNFAGMMACLKGLDAGSVIVLHACCHNPTGADLSDAQWAEVVASASRGLVPFLDMAYQGFADGIDADAVAVRLLRSGLQFFVSSSFSKSFSLYGERVGALSIVTPARKKSARVLSQLKRVIRTNYSNPPIHGGAMVAVLPQPNCAPSGKPNWPACVTASAPCAPAGRCHQGHRRAQDFSFVAQQRGMFSYTGLTAAQVERMKDEFGIYAVSPAASAWLR